MSNGNLFQPIQIGDLNLRHRVVLAPLTRLRANQDHVPTDIVTTYYEQRSRTKGTLLISEASLISAAAGGLPHAPHVETNTQLDAWKKVIRLSHFRESSLTYSL